MFLLPMLSTLLLVSVADDAEPAAINGRCDYPPETREQAPATTLVQCNSFSVEREQGMATFSFRQRGWERMTRYAGELDGDRLYVRQMTLHDGRTVEADGTCEIFHRNDGSLSVVTCLARANLVVYAANFMPSRI